LGQAKRHFEVIVGKSTPAFKRNDADEEPSSNCMRDRVARALGPIVTYKSGPKDGEPVAPDVETWFQQDQYQGNPHLVAQ
jgi:hypothetical protein